MARPYTINISNGQGTENILSGDYTVTSEITGYNNQTITPSNVIIDKTTATYAFTISASGTLNLHVTEEGTSEGTPVVGATFIRCDSEGNEYGSIITTNSVGVATFNNLPYDVTSKPLIYYKQKSSDGNHEFDSSLKSIESQEETATLEIINEAPLLRTIELTETNYEGLTIPSGTIMLS